MDAVAIHQCNPSKNVTRTALYMVIGVFCVWGLSYGLLDVLNKHFQESMHVTKAQSGLLQFFYFLAYFLIAIPAGIFNEKYGYKNGILLGLIIFSTGSLLFIPASSMMSFNFFLLAIFILATGLGCLESAANPYITTLGPPESGTRRLNLAQSFCGLAVALGPLLGGRLFFNEKDFVAVPASHQDMVLWVYACLACIVLIFALAITKSEMPEFKVDDKIGIDQGICAESILLRNRHHFIGGVIALFFYMAAQVGAGAFFINYATENWHGVTSKDAAFLLSLSMFLFVAGRFIGTFIMQYTLPRKLLSYYALANTILSAIVIFSSGVVAVLSLMATFFFMSIMFPTIFALGIDGLGERTKKASSILLMSVIGGAIAPYVMGRIADKSTTAHSYIVVLVSFAMVFLYGLHHHAKE
jgi:FHS family L-fucose permease-like MFS transporter